jgi:hypothetical protein
METLLDVGDVAGPAWEPAAGAAKESAMPASPDSQMRSPADGQVGRVNSASALTITILPYRGCDEVRS